MGGCPEGRFSDLAAARSCRLSMTWKMDESPAIAPLSAGACDLSRAGWEKLLPPGVEPITDHAPSRFARANVSCIVPGPFFFFQAEDGIRGGTVTGVQTCALPI